MQVVMASLRAFGFFSLLWVIPALDQACESDAQDGSCTVLHRDHQLLQMGGGALRVAHAAHQTVPGQFDCTGMVNVEKVCSENQCRVLANNMRGKSCEDFCAANGRKCVWAAEEVDESCRVQHHLRCNQVWGTTTDLLCECSAQPAARHGQAPTTLSDASGLQLVWSDEFNEDHINTSKWNLLEGGGGFGNQELQFYTSRPSNVLVANGVLTITATCESYKGHHFTSAKLHTKHRGDWGPGHRVEVRAKVPKAKGTWPAIWMLSSDQAFGRWPRSGEIDIMESVGCTADKIYGTVHTEAYNHMLHTEKYNTKRAAVDTWHTYAIEWTQTEISWYLDGNLFHSFAPDSYEHKKWPFDHQFHIILNLAVGGSWGGYCLHGRPSCHKADEFGRPQVMEVDYARVYRL